MTDAEFDDLYWSSDGEIEDATIPPTISTLDRILGSVRDVISTGANIYKEIHLAPVEAAAEAKRLQSAAALSAADAPGNVADWGKLLLYLGLGLGAVLLGTLVWKRAT